MNEIQAYSVGTIKALFSDLLTDLPTDRRVGDESLEQPWLRGMRLRLWPSLPAPASTRWVPELMVLSAVVVRTRPGEPLRLPASQRRGMRGKLGRRSDSEWLQTDM